MGLELFLFHNVLRPPFQLSELISRLYRYGLVRQYIFAQVPVPWD